MAGKEGENTLGCVMTSSETFSSCRCSSANCLKLSRMGALSSMLAMNVDSRSSEIQAVSTLRPRYAGRRAAGLLTPLVDRTMSARTHLTICVLGCFMPMLTTQPSVSYLRTRQQTITQTAGEPGQIGMLLLHMVETDLCPSVVQRSPTPYSNLTAAHMLL